MWKALNRKTKLLLSLGERNKERGEERGKLN